MVMKLNTKVEFCGSERKFQRCANRELKDYQKTIEDIQDKLTPLAERTRDFNFQLNELNDELNIIDKHIELLDKLDDATDDEIRESMKLNKDKIELQKKIHELRVSNDEAEKEDRSFYEELDNELRKSYGEFASKIFSNFEVDDIEEAVKELKGKNIQVEEIRIDEYTEKKFTFFNDPDGLPLELYEK